MLGHKSKDVGGEVDFNYAAGLNVVSFLPLADTVGGDVFNRKCVLAFVLASKFLTLTIIY